MTETFNATGPTQAPWNGGVQPTLPSSDEVYVELERILASPLFAHSDRLGRFLRFTAEHALNGTGDTLKEYVIGISVYDRKPPYHPSQDSIVRTEARRLRAKLKEYYETEGKSSRVFIYYRPGSYLPVFHRNGVEAKLQPETLFPIDNELLSSGNGVRIAVLPFVDLSGLPLSRQTAQSMTDELIHAFTHTDGLHVASRTAVEQAMSQQWDMRTLSSKLDIVAAIEGSVRIEDGKLRVAVRVVNELGFQTGSHRFETLAEPAVIAELQQQIVQAFITRARPLQSSIRKGKASAGSLTLAIYPIVVHAETMLNEGSSADIQPAMLKFQEAIELAPSFARPYYGVAQCHIDLALRGVAHSGDRIECAIAAAEKAVAIDPEMFGCYSTLATANALAWNWKESELQFELAAELGIHGPSARQYSLYLALQGRFQEGAEHLALAQRTDPFSYRQKVAYAKFLSLAGRFEDVLESPINTGRFGDVPFECRVLTALAACQLGLHNRATEIVEQIQKTEQPHSGLLTAVAEILALSGNQERADKIVRQYELFSTKTPLSNFRRALLTLALGDETGASSHLESAYAEREAELIWMKVDPRFQKLHALPSYQKLVSKIFN